MPKGQGARRRAGILLELTADQLRDLDALSKAHFGTARVRLIRQAIEEFVEHQISNDAGLRQRFEDARSKMGTSSQPLRLIAPDPTRK